VDFDAYAAAWEDEDEEEVEADAEDRQSEDDMDTGSDDGLPPPAKVM